MGKLRELVPCGQILKLSRKTLEMRETITNKSQGFDKKSRPWMAFLAFFQAG
jgi:hypothetical protein